MANSRKAEKKPPEDWFASRKLELLAFTMLIALVALVAWPFVTQTVEAGHVGVYYSRFFGGTVLNRTLNEGLRFLLPWDSIFIYDARAQSMDFNIPTLTKGGLNVNVDITAIWLIKKESVSELHKSMGPDYAAKIIGPSVTSVVRSVIGGYEQDQLYDGNPIQLQNDVTNLLNETLINAPFGFEAILVREVKLPEQMSGAIGQKFVSEQNVLAERYKVLEAVERFKRSYVDAESTRLAQSITNEGMSEAYLRYLGIEATKELAQSDNAKLVIIGDKDGLPLLMNADSLTESSTLPDGLVASEYIDEEEGKRIREFLENYDEIVVMLDKIEDISDGLSSRFPEVEDDDFTESLPQVNKVPTVNDEGK